VSAAPSPSRPALWPVPDTAARRRRHLRVVREPRRRHALLWALVTMVVAAGLVFGTVSINALAAGNAVEARELEAAVNEAEQRYGELVAEVARLEDPARIEQAAAELGMVRAESPRYLVVERVLPADGAADRAVVDAGETADPLKPVLSAER
jgi:cell division protein FtsL